MALNYQDYEKAVYEWLLNWHQKDDTFCFSTRQKSAKGAEQDYFIGTKKSDYFGTTFWIVPVSFPGSSSDLINLMFEQESGKYLAYIQFYQTKSPHDEQNKLALEFIVGLKKDFKEAGFNLGSESNEKKKMEYYSILLCNYIENFEDFKKGLEEKLNVIIPLIDKNILKFKETNPSFEGSKIDREMFENVFQKKLKRRLNPIISITNKPKVNDEEKKINKIKQPLNQLLYGPPGTGKTYHTINKALSIIEGIDEKELENEQRSEIKERFDKYINQGQIVFTTFHQSMSYEDFVEGIKPDIEEDKEGVRSVVYEKKDGIFKELCNKARVLPIEYTDGKQYHFEDAWNELLGQVQNHQEIEKDYVLEILTPKKGLKVTEITNSGNLRLTPTGNIGKEYTVSFSRLKVLQNAIPDVKKVSNIDKEFRAVIGGMNSTAYWATLNFINKWLAKANGNRILKEPSNKPKAHVLIIDEINRGNVSQIFGELITLIEKDKRAGESEALEIMLPYSHEMFSVPNNLYIIGTMNTADRSVEALDSALRRRFSFSEMPPKPELLSSPNMLLNRTISSLNLRDEELNALENDFKELFRHDFKSPELERKFNSLDSAYEFSSLDEILNYFDFSGLKLDVLLIKINERLEVLLSKDHQIGHSYFMEVSSWNDLKDVLYDKIIPLLQEYFYGDYGKIGLVLGYGFVNQKESKEDVFAFFSYETDSLQKDVYDIIDYRTEVDIDTLNPKNKEDRKKLSFKLAIDILMNKDIWVI